MSETAIISGPFEYFIASNGIDVFHTDLAVVGQVVTTGQPTLTIYSAYADYVAACAALGIEPVAEYTV